MESRIGAYRLDSRIGDGPFGMVYQATDTIRRRSVALKILKPGLIPDRLLLRRFIEKMRPLTELVHPGVAWIWEIDQADGQTFIASRYVEGLALRARLLQHGPLPWAEAFPLIKQAAAILEMLHGRQLVHGDLHAGNLLITNEHGVVLSDIGMAVALAGLAEIEPPAMPDTSVDSFGLAHTLVEALTAQVIAAEPGEYPRRLLHGEAGEVPRQFPVLTPRRLGGVLRRALASVPSQRFPTLTGFIEGLQAAADHPNAWPTPKELAALQAAEKTRLENEEQARQASEEAGRQAALEQARREIEDGIQRAQERSERELAEAQARLAPASPTSPPASPTPESTPPAARSTPRLRTLGLLAVALAVLALLFYASLDLFPGAKPPTPTPSQTSGVLVSSPAPSLTPSPTATLAPATPSFTPSLTSTLTPLPTATPTPSLTPSVTYSATPTVTETPWRSPTATWPTPKPTKTRAGKPEKATRTPTPTAP